MNLTPDTINVRIKNEICYQTIHMLSDEHLMPEYMNSSSVKNEITKLNLILDKYVDENIKTCIMSEYIHHLIPAGTKGVIRGNKFNQIVKQSILNMNIDQSQFLICFEKHCDSLMTTEKPDWFIQHISTGKTIIGMNQLDLWNGGHQLNRGSKYIKNTEHNNAMCKLLCVVCNEIQFKNKKSKAFELFAHGFTHNTLCYINNLQSIIRTYFNIATNTELNCDVSSCLEIDLGPTVLLNSK